MRFDVGDVVRVVDAWDPNMVNRYSDRDKYLGTNITIRKVYHDMKCYSFMEDEHEPHDDNPEGTRYIIRESEIVGFAEELNIDIDEFSKILNGDNCEVI